MCGIAGIVSKNKANISLPSLKEMSDVIAHRGPDGDGQWIDADGHVGLAHRRLSIIDLSDAGSQPMHYLDRYTIVFNGEIYNYVELREGLVKNGYRFKSTCDTEVLMALYDKYKTSCLSLLDGMFAFAIYDAEEKKLFCARDRFGEKPFFYHYEKGKVFQFASEMKALWQAGVSRDINNRMLFNYLSSGYLDNPTDASETFYTACNKLPHSHYLIVDVPSVEVSINRYYDIKHDVINTSITEEQAIEQFKQLMFTSVKRRLRSDVPVGSSLSGGLDSSLIVCLIDRLIGGTGQVQKTFSAVFPGFAKDESKYIDTVVAATHAQASFVTPGADGLLADLNKVMYHQEEPIGSASIYVQYCVMQLARQHNVTVLLDGQGSDEILAGYHFFFKRYFGELAGTDKDFFKRELDAYKQMAAINTVNANVYNGITSKLAIHFQKLAPKGEKLLADISELRSPFFNKDFYYQYRKESFKNADRENTLNQSLYSSVMKKGLQELLRYADRNSMAHSREVRVPFLSHELVDFLFTLPASFKIRNGWTKWILRQAFNDVLPPSICWRKDKIGYEPPQKSWLSGNGVQAIIADKRKKLIDAKIMHASMAQKPIKAHDAVAFNNREWKIWMAAHIL